MALGRRKSPNVFHPEKASAVGSKNSLAQFGRDQDSEFRAFVEESSQKVMKHLTNKLPPEALTKLDVMGGVKEKLYNYVNQTYVNMFNRYLTTVEDEMAKKTRDFVDREEQKAQNRYNPKEISELLDQIGGAERFNTGEMEKATINMYGHLHGHIQRGMTELEQETNSLLRQKSDVGAFVRGQNFYSVIKCAFKDDKNKPKTVMNVKLSLNILDNELISPIFHHQVTVEFIVKELLTRSIIEKLDKAMDAVNEALVDKGETELSPVDVLIKKMTRIEDYTSDDIDDEKSKRYSFLAKSLLDSIEGLKSEINPKDYDALNVRENVRKIIDDSGIRTRGFNTCINTLTNILDTSKLGYQFCENMKNTREFIIREYEDTDEDQLPDERYQLKLKYYNQSQVNAERVAYDKQLRELMDETDLALENAKYLSENNKRAFGVHDYTDLVAKTRNWRRKNLKEGELLYEEKPKEWDEMIDISPEETDIEKSNRTYNLEKQKMKNNLTLAMKVMQETFNYQNPKKRIILEDRVQFLLKKLADFDYRINSYHIQPGLMLEMDITTTKRKRYIMQGMSNVLNEFLATVSKGFEDAAFASFSRRRSTVREDIERDFMSIDEMEEEEDKPVNSAKPSHDEGNLSEPPVRNKRPPSDDVDLEDL